MSLKLRKVHFVVVQLKLASRKAGTRRERIGTSSEVNRDQFGMVAARVRLDKQQLMVRGTSILGLSGRLDEISGFADLVCLLARRFLSFPNRADEYCRERTIPFTNSEVEYAKCRTSLRFSGVSMSLITFRASCATCAAKFRLRGRSAG